MKDQEFVKIIRQVNGILKTSFFIIAVLFSIVFYMVLDLWSGSSETKSISIAPAAQDVEIRDGIHIETGLKAGNALPIVIQNCTPCHSAKLITQNRMTAEGWKSTIQWMQQTQNLWDLGENEVDIINYLATYYAPQKKGRRARLKEIEWYELD